MVLKNCGWFGIRFKNIQCSICPTKRGQRPELILEVTSKTCQNDFKLHICGWFGIRFENIQSDPPKEIRGQSQKFTSEITSKTSQNDFKLHTCGWFGIRFENIQSDPFEKNLRIFNIQFVPPNEVRGQS